MGGRSAGVGLRWRAAAEAARIGQGLNEWRFGIPAWKIQADFPALFQTLVVLMRVGHPVGKILALALLALLESGFIRHSLTRVLLGLAFVQQSARCRHTPFRAKHLHPTDYLPRV